jgi:hypothetical protein
MKFRGLFSLVSFVFLMPALSLASGVSVSSPANGAQVDTSFNLDASSTSCSSQNVSAMGYSFDSSSQTTIVDAESIDTTVSTSVGSHVLHVKSWGSSGASCVQDVSITVVSSSGGGGGGNPTIPSNAIAATDIDVNTSLNWKWNHDAGTPGSSTGTSTIVSSPSEKGKSRQYAMSYKGSGGEIFYIDFANDTSATHFVYDNWVWIDNTAGIENLEMDMNQVMANGNTVIYGFQCDGSSGTWDYTYVSGGSHWRHSSASCNPKHWTPNAWHHVQIAYYRDSVGNVTYQYVTLDGVKSNINQTVYSADALNWTKGVLLTNFQIDGSGSSGSVTAYTNSMTIYRW